MQKMHVIMNLVHIVSPISRSHTSFKYILYDMMLIRSYPGNVGHSLDLDISF